MSSPSHRHSARQLDAGRPAPNHPSDERAVPLVAPPDTVAHPAVERLPAPSLPALPQSSPLVLGLSTVDHSGRIRDRLVLTALNWHPGDRTHAAIRGTTVLIRRTPTGGITIDTRGRVHLPAGARALLGIATDERIVLLANLLHDLLIVHPTRVVTALLTTHHPW